MTEIRSKARQTAAIPHCLPDGAPSPPHRASAALPSREIPDHQKWASRPAGRSGGVPRVDKAMGAWLANQPSMRRGRPTGALGVARGPPRVRWGGRMRPQPDLARFGANPAN